METIRQGEMMKGKNEKYTNDELLLMGHSRDLDIAVAHNHKIDFKMKVLKVLEKHLKIGKSGFSGEQQIYGLFNAAEEIADLKRGYQL